MAIHLFIACYYGHIEIVKLLFNNNRVDVNQANVYGQTPFWIACKEGHIEIIEYIIASGREVNVNTNNQRIKEINFNRRRRGNEERKRIYGKIVELLESFERNPIEIRFKLRLKLGLIGKIQFHFFEFYFLFFFFFPFFFLLKCLISQDNNAASLFAIIVLISDDFFSFKQN